MKLNLTRLNMVDTTSFKGIKDEIIPIQTDNKPLVHTYSRPKVLVAQKRVKVLSGSEKMFTEKYSQQNIINFTQAKISTISSQEQRLGFKGNRKILKTRSKSILNKPLKHRDKDRNYIVTGHRTRVIHEVAKRNTVDIVAPNLDEILGDNGKDCIVKKESKIKANKDFDVKKESNARELDELLKGSNVSIKIRIGTLFEIFKI